MFECLVCGVCTGDALVYAAPRVGAVAFCGRRCSRVFRQSPWKFIPAEADHGGGD